MLLDRGQSLPQVLSEWWEEYIDGLRPLPIRKAGPAHRHPRLSYIWRNIPIQITIEMLCRVGMLPYATAIDETSRIHRASGCAAVTSALQELGMTPTREDGDLLWNIQRIWDERFWKKPIKTSVEKYEKFTVKRIRS